MFQVDLSPELFNDISLELARHNYIRAVKVLRQRTWDGDFSPGLRLAKLTVDAIKAGRWTRCSVPAYAGVAPTVVFYRVEVEV